MVRTDPHNPGYAHMRTIAARGPRPRLEARTRAHCQDPRAHSCEVHSCIQSRCPGIVYWVLGVTHGFYGRVKARFLISSTRPTWFCASGHNSQTFRLDARLQSFLVYRRCVLFLFSLQPGVRGSSVGGGRRRRRPLRGSGREGKAVQHQHQHPGREGKAVGAGLGGGLG